ncbi:MAG: hypothetical protein U0790_16505 [Isosphaeraceae bacterium]
METSLHRALKDRYGEGLPGRSEVTLDGFRIDAIDEAGVLIEVQSGPLAPLRAKLKRLLPRHRVRVVKPVALDRRVVRRTRRDGPDLSARRSPWRGELIDAFEHLVGLATLFPAPRLEVEILGVSVEEIRIPRRRWPGYHVVDRRLARLRSRHLLCDACDLWQIIPQADWDEPFTTAEIASRTGRPLWLAQRVAYCLRLTGAARVVGKRGNHLVYVRNEVNEGSVPGDRVSADVTPPRRLAREAAPT